MAPKGKKPPSRGAGPGARPAAADPGIDIVFDKPKPKSRGHRQRSAEGTNEHTHTALQSACASLFFVQLQNEQATTSAISDC